MEAVALRSQPCLGDLRGIRLIMTSIPGVKICVREGNITALGRQPNVADGEASGFVIDPSP
jgi:hypothetical protein